MTIRRMDHFTVVTNDLEATQAFYQRLGLAVGPRPDFGPTVGGVWLYAGGHAVLHVVTVATMPTPRRGAIDHVAFFGDDITALLETCLAHHLPYRLIRQPRPWSGWQVFIDDPNGVEVEIDFDATEQVPPHLKAAARPF